MGIVGAPVVRQDAAEKTGGRALYGDDLRLPGLLHGRVLRSPHAHARILHVDVSRARSVPGVRAVVTGADLPARGGEAIADQPFLAVERARFAGEAVAAVAAADADAAAEAVELIRVEYEPLPPVLDALAALQPDAPLVHEALHTYRHIPVIHPEPGTNVCHHITLRKGDVDEGFARSDEIFEDTFTTQMVAHGAIEPHMAIAQVFPGGRVTVWAPNDGPHRLRKDLADALGLGLDHVRVISPPYLGGGFGGKGGIKAEGVAVALAHFCGGRPVKVVLSRAEVFTSSLVRHPSVVTLRTGVTRDGRFVARSARLVYDTGAYAEKGPTVCQQASVAAVGPYRIPHVAVDGYCVYTNRPVAGAYRGYGIPQVAWAHETQMDIIAQRLGLDPLEIRLRNVVTDGDTAPAGRQILQGVGLRECLLRAAEAIRWEERPAGPFRGKGIACAFKNTKTPSGSSAFVKVNPDGSAEVVASTVEVGQGARTILAQIAAHELGLDLDRVTVGTPDTAVTPFDASTTSSRSTFHMGNAVREAAADARGQLLTLAAAALGVPLATLTLCGGAVWTSGARALPVAELLRRSRSAGFDVLGRGSYYPDLGAEASGLWSAPSVFWMYGAQAADVEVDPDTGRVRIHEIVAAHDVGKAINPVTCRQQIEGGVVHGLGPALVEEMLIDGQGRVVNPSFHDYRMPTAVDAPRVRAILVETPDARGPYGAKGLGEMPTVPTAAAIGNALARATGVRLTDLPLSAERVSAALRARAQTGKGRSP